MDPRRQFGYGQQQQPQQQQQQNPQSQRQHQRFSWQVPVDEETQQYQQPHQQRHQRQPQPAQATIDEDPRSRAFSYAQTPVEHRRQFFTSSADDPPLPGSPPTPIDPRPQSIYLAHNNQTQPQPQAAYLSAPAYIQDEKPPPSHSPVSPQEGTLLPLRSPVSPLTPLPQAYAQETVAHSRHHSNLQPINTNVGRYNLPPLPPTPHSHNTQGQASPLPIKAPITPITPDPLKQDPAQLQLPMSPNSRKSIATEPYSPHGFSATPTHTVFSPHSAHGPNGLDFALHQPGQIAHPNMDMSGDGSTHEWKHSLCECSGDMGTCLTGLFCPCILYGRTSYRLTAKSEKKDPTDMLAYKATNGHCMLMSISCGLWWLFPMVQRTRLRHLYKLTGSFGSDLLKGCCCCCCVAVQNEREIRDREASKRQWAGPASTQIYTAPSQMVYAPQR